MTTLSTDTLTNLKRTTWSILPASLHEAGTLAFPNCKSPRTVPDDKWEKLAVAYKTWYHIFYSDGLSFSLSCKDFPPERKQRYLNDIAVNIAKE